VSLRFRAPLQPGGSSVPILPADLIFKTANGEDRLTYESLVMVVLQQDLC
jgi:hypothetical protein